MSDVPAIVIWAVSGIMIGMLLTLVAIVLSALIGRLNWILPLTAFLFSLSALFLLTALLLIPID